MSKKNNLARRKRQHEFELQKEKEQKEKNEKKLQAKKNKMKVDNTNKMKKKGASGFSVKKKKVKTKLTALTKAKAAQAMEGGNVCFRQTDSRGNVKVGKKTHLVKHDMANFDSFVSIALLAILLHRLIAGGTFEFGEALAEEHRYC
ncbi:conserved hypothetical protein [Ricinus communis]|uniref:Uncharacterized protein n=1 Tax=Ricinus communis TaxID=3988 RepID=B9RDQ5_RICCO|nr:conserved hypothetical protein [Ricinus communis]